MWNIMGVGSVKVKQFDDKVTTLDNVRLIHEVRRDLLFISALGKLV